MSPFLRDLLRCMALGIFLGSLIIVWVGPDAHGVDWRWFFTCLFAGNALFAASFMGGGDTKPGTEPETKAS